MLSIATTDVWLILGGTAAVTVVLGIVVVTLERYLDRRAARKRLRSARMLHED